MWPIAGEKKIKKTRSTQAATKSAKSGFIQTHQKESFLFRRWQETRHEVYSGRHQECQVRRQISQKERFLPSLARETRHEVYPDRAIKSAKSGGRPVGKNALFRRCLARCAATYCCSFESAVNTIVYRTPMEYKPSFVVLLFCRSCLCVTTSLFWS